MTEFRKIQIIESKAYRCSSRRIDISISENKSSLNCRLLDETRTCKACTIQRVYLVTDRVYVKWIGLDSLQDYYDDEIAHNMLMYGEA